MIDTALYFLHKTALQLPKNQYAKAIYNSFRNAGNDVDLHEQNLLKIPFDNEATLDENNPVDVERNKDYRFLYLYLRSFRKFPLIDDYYGISFCKVEEENYIPESTLLQGANGSGKTSVFGAMEYLFTGRMSAAEKQRFLSKQELEDYIPYAGKTKKDVDIHVATKSFEFNLDLDNAQQQDVRRLCFLPFFCSEYDVDKVIKEDIDDFIYEQMGYTLTRWIILNVENELKAILKQSEEREEPLESVISRIEDYEIQIRMFDIVWSSFSSILLKTCNNNQSSKKKTEILELKKALSKSFFSRDAPDIPIPIDNMVLSLDNLNAEMDAIGRVLGKKSRPQQVMQLYSQVKELFDLESEHPEPLLKPSLSKKENREMALKDLNCFRRIFKEMIEICIVSDMASTIEWKNTILNQLNKDRQDALNVRTSYELVDSIISQKEVYEEFLNTLKREVFDKIDDITKDSREFVNKVMEFFLMEDEAMEMEFDKNTGKFRMNITLKVNGNPILFTPEKYLNTFRYKLYCMTLKMAIAFSMKKFYHINFPIVIDDVFYSSDFNHRCQVRDFFGLFFYMHKELFPKEDLQVIFLTHDDVVVDAAYNGITDIIGCSDVNRQMMFDYREADKSHTEKLPFKSADGKQATVSIKNITIS